MIKNDRVENHIEKVHKNRLSYEKTISIRTLPGGLPSLGKKK
jgi:hypothetical protein